MKAMDVVEVPGADPNDGPRVEFKCNGSFVHLYYDNGTVNDEGDEVRDEVILNEQECLGLVQLLLKALEG